jgi:hypothetical protein
LGEEKEYREWIEAVRGIQKQSDQMRRQLSDVRAILKDALGDRKKKAEDLEKEIVGSLPGLTVPLLEIGARAGSFFAVSLSRCCLLKTRSGIKRKNS